MKIYVASSWRNPFQPKIVEVLREDGHEVFDFRNPDPSNPTNHGFGWRQTDPTWEMGQPVSVRRWRSMLAHPAAAHGFALDFGGMNWAEVCVYVLPCGRSASWELGYMMGAGKPGIVLALDPVEPELMFSGASIVGSLAEMLMTLARLERERTENGGAYLEDSSSNISADPARPRGRR